MLSVVMKISGKNNQRKDSFIFDLQFQSSMVEMAQQQQCEEPGHIAGMDRKLQQQCEALSHIEGIDRKL